ncbi:zinc finger protein ZAT7-like [Curcuma longa]|uniref:zinc finger protein ZAT7-like n=1 Tax=Curcuma longa TaxID=136217 RepID=UPI003D9F4239
MAGGERGEQRRLYECKTCCRRFATFQALGGHRTAHARQLRCGGGEAAPRQMLSLRTSRAPHACPVCGLTFPMGQALGGHMRRHKTAAVAAKPGATMAAGKQLLWLDLNLPPLESELHLQFVISEEEGSSNAVDLVPNCSSYSA